MEELPIQGVILEPSRSEEFSPSLASNISFSAQFNGTTHSAAIKLGALCILIVVVGCVAAAYFVSTTFRKLSYELTNTQEQLKQAQNQYGSTFQEKTQLQSVFASVSAELDSLKGNPGTKKIISFSSNQFPVMFVSGQSQKAGQSFKPLSSSPVDLVGIQVYANYGKGQNINLAFYEFDGHSLDSEKKLADASASASISSTKKSLNFTFDHHLQIDPKKNYFFVLEAENLGTEADVVFTENDSDNTGSMFEYTSLLDGNGQVIKSNFSWVAREGQDLKYNALVD